MGHRVSKGPPPRQQECLWKSLLPARRTQEYAREATRGVKRLLIPSCFTGQKRSSRKSHGLTDNLQKKGPEVHKAGLRQQTYPELVPENQFNLGSSVSQSSKDGHINLRGTASRRPRCGPQPADKARVLLAARLRRSRRAAGAAHRAARGSGTSGLYLAIADKTLTQSSRRRHRAVQDNPTPAAQVVNAQRETQPIIPPVEETTVEAPPSQGEGAQEFALPALGHSDVETTLVPPDAPNASPLQAALEQGSPLQSTNNNGISCEVVAQAHQPDAPLAGQEADAASTQAGSASEAAPSQDTLNSGEEGTGIPAVEAAHQANPNLPSLPTISPSALQIFDHGADKTTSALHRGLPDEEFTSQAASAAAQNNDGLLEMHSGEALQAVVDTSSQQYTSPAVANAIMAMQARSCPDAQHRAVELHSTGQSGQRKTPKLTAPDDNSTGSPSRHKLPALRLARGISLPANQQALLLAGTPGVAQHASIGEEALRQRRARLHAALDSAFGSLTRREAMRKAFGALEANAIIERLARDNCQRRDIFAQLYDRFNETKRAARGLQRQVQDQQSELDELRSQNAFLVDKMVPLKNLVTNYKALNSQLQARLTDTEDREKEALTKRIQLQIQLQTRTKQLRQAQDILKDVPTHKQAFEYEYGPRICALEREVWRLEDEARNHKANLKWVRDREMLEDKHSQLSEVRHQLVLRIVYLEQENMRLRIQTGETELSAPLQSYMLPAEWSAPYPRSWSTEDQNMWLKAGLKALMALAEQGSLLTEEAILQGQKAAFMKLKEEAAQTAMQQGAALPKTLAQVFEEHCVQQEAALLAAAAEPTNPSMSEQTAALCEQMVAQVLSLEEPSAQQALVLPGAAQHGVQSAAQQDTAWPPQAGGESSSSRVMHMIPGEAQQQGSHTQVCEIAQPNDAAAEVPEPEDWQSSTPILASHPGPLLSPISSSGFFTPDQLHLQTQQAPGTRATLTPGASQPVECPSSKFTTSAASPAGSTVSTIVFSSSATSSGSSTGDSSGYQSTPQTSLAQALPGVIKRPANSGCLPTDSGHLPADKDNRSTPLSATKGSLPAFYCPPMAREGVHISQGVLLPEICLAEARVDLPPVFDAAAFLAPEEISLFGVLEGTQAQTNVALFGQGWAHMPLFGDLVAPANPLLQQW